MTQAQYVKSREYETIYIMNPNIDQDATSKVASRVSGIIEKLDGKLVKVDNWGRRRLAYPIQKHQRGHFVYLRYLGYNDLVAELERNFRLLDEVIRYQTIKLRDHVDKDQVTVDPEETTFAHPEDEVEEQRELSLEERLGMVSYRHATKDESGEDSSDEGAQAADSSESSDSESKDDSSDDDTRKADETGDTSKEEEA